MVMCVLILLSFLQGGLWQLHPSHQSALGMGQPHSINTIAMLQKCMMLYNNNALVVSILHVNIEKNPLPWVSSPPATNI